MLPPKNTLPPDQQRLLKSYRGLSEQDRHALLRYAEFLSRQEQEPTAEAAAPQQPADIPRPADESVIAAIRRLSQTFPMLEKDVLLHETSGLMTAHVMQGRPAVEVIDELEILFRRHYERVKPSSE